MKRLLLLLLPLILTACIRVRIERVVQTETPTPEMLIVRRTYPTREPTNTPYIAPVVLTLTAMADSRETVFIDGVSRGYYGQTVVTNDGTDHRLEYIGYFVPAGQYRATNNRNNMAQLNVYSSSTYWDKDVE